MRLSIETGTFFLKFGEEKTFELLSEAGFDGVDFSFDVGENFEGVGADYINYAKRMRGLLDKYGLECVQAHAPYNMRENNAFDESDPLFLKVVRSIEAASILGAKNIVVHSIDVSPKTDVNEINYRYYKALEPYAEKFNMVIGVENLFTWIPEQRYHLGRLARPKEMNAFVKSLNSPHFAVCVDVGHAAITGIEPQDYIANIDSDILKILHIHDNDKCFDLHNLPFVSSMDFEKITTALSEKGYDGDFSYEIAWRICRFPEPLVPEALRLAACVGRYLISKITGE